MIQPNEEIHEDLSISELIKRQSNFNNRIDSQMMTIQGSINEHNLILLINNLNDINVTLIARISILETQLNAHLREQYELLD